MTSPPVRRKKIGQPVSVVVLSKGIFKSKTLSVFPSEFVNKVVDRMSHGEQLSEEERDLYFKEYINMCFGRFISVINNQTGQSTRFVIPVMVRGTFKDEEAYEYKEGTSVDFDTDLGRVNISVNYEVLPQFSSN